MSKVQGKSPERCERKAASVGCSPRPMLLVAVKWESQSGFRVKLADRVGDEISWKPWSEAVSARRRIANSSGYR